MFLDLAVLVNEQGSVLNSVEQHVDKAVVYTHKVVEKVDETRKHQMSIKCKKCMIFLIVFVGAIGLRNAMCKMCKLLVIPLFVVTAILALILTLLKG